VSSREDMEEESDEWLMMAIEKNTKSLSQLRQELELMKQGE